jgi:DNA-directed RNA polymerase specialized sigma24 family protein
VSRLLGLPEGTVKSRLFHARERMKETLKWMT